ncbi:mitochondrial carrier [Conidiobolus coronatus NRRL 28638]|uniref:Mitochondrial carrier n=1 Tax=Conidiobolus coronatus (strain ATCC 28846 / CBS 209.66 / NRRL 28638) TaxID=796925 RepID=A0A137NXG1_CONC2|nr:mitochondrial carrier [Conidiobolus coronatus NRRL 28638]|eukprot:KXN67540.1 mitochondrial carrier [Conidiobolus coronatus NRRL 28638]
MTYSKIISQGPSGNAENYKNAENNASQFSFLNNDKFRSTIYDYRATAAAGSAGIFSVVIGYPFDTLKTRMQVTEPPRTMQQCFRDVAKSEGTSALWRGMAGPLFIVSFLKAITFTSYDSCSKFLLKTVHGPPPEITEVGSDSSNPKISPQHYSHLPFTQRVPLLILAGAYAGSVTGLVSSPLEFVKVQLQLGRLAKSGLIKPQTVNGVAPAVIKDTTIGTITKIIRDHGFFKLYNSFGTYLLKDGIGTGIYFGLYETFKFSWLEILGSTSSYAPFVPLLAGGMSGTLSWLVIFPFDLVKSRLQREGLFPPAQRQYQGPWDCFKKLKKEGGTRIFYRGIGPTLIRALPIHSLNFFVYESVLGYINRNYKPQQN